MCYFLDLSPHSSNSYILHLFTQYIRVHACLYLKREIFRNRSNIRRYSPLTHSLNKHYYEIKMYR